MIHYVTIDGIGSAWIAAELRIVENRGIPCQLHALRPPLHDFYSSAWALEMNARTRRVYPLRPLPFLGSQLAAPFLFRGRWFAGLFNAIFGRRESLEKRIKAFGHFFVACHVARGLRGEEVSLIHAHWAHAACTVAMYTAWLLGSPFSFTGHAVDLFRERVALADKVRRADFISCISTFHRKLYVDEFQADPSKLHLVYCGLDVEQFDYRYEGPRNPVPRIVSVGRLVEKKGFGIMIDAVGILSKRGVACSAVIVGDGPLEEELKAQVRRLGLDEIVDVTGKPILQEHLSDFLAEAELFAQPCVWSRDNDVDGTPRTLMEAMATGLPSISTRIAGIPDIIEDGESGLLVEPGSAEELADALERVIADPELAGKLSRGGRKRIEEHFRIEENVEPLVNVFRRFLPDGSRPGTRREEKQLVRAERNAE